MSGYGVTVVWGSKAEITIREPGPLDFATVYARAKLLAGWPAEPNVRELTRDEDFIVAEFLFRVNAAVRL